MLDHTGKILDQKHKKHKLNFLLAKVNDFDN